METPDVAGATEYSFVRWALVVAILSGVMTSASHFGMYAAFISFIGGFFTAIVAEPLREWLHAPTLRLSFEDSDYFLTKTPESVTVGDTTIQSESLWVRVKVENASGALARSCRAYLVQVERQGARPGTFESTEYCESLQLSWSSQQKEQSFAAFDLPRGVPHFVDVISTRPTSTAFKPATRTVPMRYEKLVQTHGVYRFTVVVSGVGFKPFTTRPVVSWNGVWDQVAKVK